MTTVVAVGAVVVPIIVAAISAVAPVPQAKIDGGGADNGRRDSSGDDGRDGRTQTVHRMACTVSGTLLIMLGSMEARFFFRSALT